MKECLRLALVVLGIALTTACGKFFVEEDASPCHGQAFCLALHNGLWFTDTAQTATEEALLSAPSAMRMKLRLKDAAGNGIGSREFHQPDCPGRDAMGALLDAQGSPCLLDKKWPAIEKRVNGLLDTVDPLAATSASVLVEVFGTMNVYSIRECNSTSECDTGWKCDTAVSRDGAKNCWTYIPGRGQVSLPCETTKKFKFCYVTIPDALSARGYADDIKPNGGKQPLYLTRLNEPVLATKGDNSLSTITPSDTDEETTGLFGHVSYVLPNGRVALIGGASQDRASKEGGYRYSPVVYYSAAALQFDPQRNTYSKLPIHTRLQNNGAWVNRIDFTLTPYEEPPALTGSAVEKSAGDKLFLIVGGRQGYVDSRMQNLSQLVTDGASGETYGEIYVARFDAAGDALSFEHVGDISPRYGHSTTYLGQNRFLVAGGRDKSGAVLSDLYLIDTSLPLAAVTALSSSLSAGRYSHTASLLWQPVADCQKAKTSDLTPLVVVLGGLDENGNTMLASQTVNFITVTGESAKVEALVSNGSLDLRYLARAGHIAVPVLSLANDGSIACDDLAKARLVVYGGYRQEEALRSHFNLAADGNVVVSTISAAKQVSFFNWVRPVGYLNAMDSSIPGSNYPSVEAQWIWMDARHTTVLVAGGWQNGVGTSAWVEVLSFGADRFGGYAFGTRDSDRSETPFRLGLLPEGLARFGLVRLQNGLYYFSGGLGYNSITKRYYVSDTSATINSPNTTEIWNGYFGDMPSE